MERKLPYLLLINFLVSAILAGESPFSYELVREQARALSRQPFQARTNRVPEGLLNLTYEQYQSLGFRSDKALWSKEKLPFQIGFFLPGFIQKQTVKINEVVGNGTRPVPFSLEAFSFGTNRLSLPSDLQYAGFRILYPNQNFGEVAAFLGASYFRMVGRGQSFGTSVRGLALNTSALKDEEFPFFREFWLRQPRPADHTMTLWALMDSPSVSGAFEFVIVPGAMTVTQVKAAFYPRAVISEFGIAPLTSMFLFDRNSHPPYADFRPEVHDCDGLLVHTGRDEWIWRPLDAGRRPSLNSYLDVNPKGFGLLQRTRRFQEYQDLVARFDLRPSVWVKPLGNWGVGHVQLIQLPTDVEYNDNIVAYWVPDHPPKPGEELRLEYEIGWLTNQVVAPSLGTTQETFVGRVPAKKAGGAAMLRFVIEFDGGELRNLSMGDHPEIEVGGSEGIEFVTREVIQNDVTGAWRLVLEMATPGKASDLRARLKRAGEPLTETWTYTWQP